MSVTGTKRKTTETDGSSSDDKRAGVNPDSSDPPIKKSKSELSASGGVVAIPTATAGKTTSAPAGKHSSKIADIIKKLDAFYEIIPAQAPDKVKNAMSNAQKNGFHVPPELEAYFMACDGFKQKDDNTELLFFGLKSIIDTERDDDLNGCLVEQIEYDAVDNWEDNGEVEPLKPDHTKKCVLIGSADELGDDLFIYIVCDPKSPCYGKIVSKCTGFAGPKLVKNYTLVEALANLYTTLEEGGHEESSNIFMPEFNIDDRDGDDGDGDYNEEEEEE